MKKKLALISIFTLIVLTFTACKGNNAENIPEETTEITAACPFEDGEYIAEFITDSSMFHANEACEGKGVLTVKDGQMNLHVSLVSKSILNLYVGLASEAPKAEDKWLVPTTDTVTYKDGLSDEVYGFDIPITVVDTDFDLAIIGKKGTWYDHRVSVTGVRKFEEGETAPGTAPVSSVKNDDTQSNDVASVPADGQYNAEVTLTGGTGKSTIESPAVIEIKDGVITAKLVWTSKNYDYMIVDGTKYLNEAAEGEKSTFTVTVKELDKEFPIIGDTVAMSTPHEIEYTLLLKIAE